MRTTPILGFSKKSSLVLSLLDYMIEDPIDGVENSFEAELIRGT